MTDSEKIDRLLDEVFKMRNEIIELKTVNDRMNDHITFIESIYGTIRLPFLGLMNMVSNIIPFNENNILLDTPYPLETVTISSKSPST